MAKAKKKRIVRAKDVSLSAVRRNPGFGSEVRKVVRKVRRKVSKLIKPKRNPQRGKKRPRALRYVITAHLRDGGTMYFDGKHWHENRDRADVFHSASAVRSAMRAMKNSLPLQIESVEGKRV